MLLRDGRIVNERGIQRGDLRIRDGRIWASAPQLSPTEGEKVIELAGKLVLPGIIDSHTHFKLHSRGTVTADDFYQGGVSAAFGGVTTVIDYAEQDPDSLLQGVEERRAEAEREAVIDYSLHLTINNHYLPGRHNRELSRLLELGIASLKIFTTYRDSYLLADWKVEELLRAAARAGLLVTAHAEDDRIIADRERLFRERGETGCGFHPDIRPGEAEAAAVRWLIRRAENSGAPLYIVHLSSKEGYAAAALARERGLPVYAETTPHYLLLTRSLLQGPEGRLNLMTPPLREKTDNDCLWKGIQSGLIEVIATDHCAFNREQKARGNDSFEILPGIPGVETLLPLIYTYGVEEGRISLSQLVSLLSANPARIFGLYPEKGSLEKGTSADLVVYDPLPERELQAAELHSRAGHSPFQGMRVRGRVAMTLLRGRIIVDGNNFYGRRGEGRFIKAGPSRVFSS